MEGLVGIPYRTGGRSLEGLDCVGLVLTYYARQFGIVLPDPAVCGWDAIACRFRSTDNPAPGDVVLMELPHLHVGILLAEGKVLHADKRHGVIIERADGLGILTCYRYDRLTA